MEVRNCWCAIALKSEGNVSGGEKVGTDLKSASEVGTAEAMGILEVEEVVAVDLVKDGVAAEMLTRDAVSVGLLVGVFDVVYRLWCVAVMGVVWNFLSASFSCCCSSFLMD